MKKLTNRLFKISAFACLLGSLPIASYAQDECAGTLVKDTFNGSYSSVENLAAYRLRYGSSYEASKVSAGATIPIYGAPINFDLASASSAASSYFDQSKLDWGTTRLESVATQTLSEVAVEAYKACRKSLSSIGPRVLVYNATATKATVSVTWFSGPGAPKKNVKGDVSVDGGSTNGSFPKNWETGQKVTRTINRTKFQDLSVIANIGGLSDDQFVSQLPPHIEKASGIGIGSCIGKGGVEGVRLWGPVSEYCNGIPAWGFYDAQSRRVLKIGSCLGHGGLEGVRLYGPADENCGGIASWGQYKDIVAVSSAGISSCKGRGDKLEGHDLWGPTGALCGGMKDPRWGLYQVGTKTQ